jgi:TatD DNase family protein
MTLVDSHCHLDFPDFDGELPAILARARAAGVSRMVTICTRLHQEPRARAIAEADEGVFYTAGVHPMSVAEHPPFTLDDLIALTRHPRMIGLGETGLDYHYTADSAPAQQASLRLHIQAAQETRLPLVIHARAADDDMARILAEGMKERPYSCVMHCFSSGAALAQAALEMGFYLSMSGIITFPKSQDLRDIFAAAPLNRVLVETQRARPCRPYRPQVR